MSMSEISRRRLATCHDDLVRVWTAVAEVADVQIICGHRGQADQTAHYEAKLSQLPWPKSRHNTIPSTAVDAAPLKVSAKTGKRVIDWKDTAGFVRLAAVVRGIAADLGVKLEWGGDWKMRDYVHWQLPR